MTKILHGRIHGRTIEVSEDLGIAEGQEVEIQLKIIPETKSWGEGIRRSAGAMADDPYFDQIMDEVHQARKLERPQAEVE